MAFSPDGKLLVGQVRDEQKTGRHWLTFWDAATGQEVASIEGEKRAYFLFMAFSPDGRTLAVSDFAGNGQGRLFLFDLTSRKLTKTVVLVKKPDEAEARVLVRGIAFDPDSKSLAVITQIIPNVRSAEGSRRVRRSRTSISLMSQPAKCARRWPRRQDLPPLRASARTARPWPPQDTAECFCGT